MKKGKYFKRTRFSADVIREALEIFYNETNPKSTIDSQAMGSGLVSCIFKIDS
jgi:hypothetical protein